MKKVLSLSVILISGCGKSLNNLKSETANTVAQKTEQANNPTPTPTPNPTRMPTLTPKPEEESLSPDYSIQDRMENISDNAEAIGLGLKILKMCLEPIRKIGWQIILWLRKS